MTEFYLSLWLSNKSMVYISPFISCWALHLNYFHSLTIMKRTAVNISMQVFLLYIDLHFFGSAHKCMAGSKGKSIFSFWGTSILIPIVVALVYIPTTVYEGFFFKHPHEHLLFVFLIIANLTGMRWNLSVVLICVSFMTEDVEHCFMYLSAICISSSENGPIYLSIF
jgi:hypothetical protein